MSNSYGNGLRVIGMIGMAALLLLAAAGTVSAQSGEEVYSSTCVSCHGPDGTGLLPGQPDFTDPGTWEGLTQDDVVAFIEAGGNMPGVGGEGDGMAADGGLDLTSEERQAVTQYIMGLAEEAEAEEAPVGEGEAGGAPGFTALFAVAGLLSVAYLVSRRS